MLRLRIVIPLLLASPFASVSALGDFQTSHCATSPTSPRCEAERAREFARARNAEINASIAAVAARRAREYAVARTAEIEASIAALQDERTRVFAAARNAEADASIAEVGAERARAAAAANSAVATRELALSKTHCKTPDSTTPRCEAERTREFAAARNAEINASIAMVKAERIRRIAQSQADCSNPDVARPRCQAERARAFAQARNAEINASIAAVEAERRREFAAARNAEINASIAAVKAERIRMLAQSQADCRNPIVTRPRCQAERAREFARARNAESNASMAAVTAERTRAFAAARNAEINASITAVKAERTRAFTAARNAEIDAAIAASQAQRALRLALEQARQSRMETGAISLPETLGPAPAPLARRTRAIGPCLEAGRLMNPLQFSDGNAEIEPAMKPELDHIAMMAQHCPAVRFEIHGHSDNAAPSQVNRHLAQRRAQAAVEYLVGAGVDRSRIAAIGHADAQPLVPNTSEQNRALNRRIEVTINDPATQAAAQRVMWDLAELLDPTYVPPLARLSP